MLFRVNLFEIIFAGLIWNGICIIKNRILSSSRLPCLQCIQLPHMQVRWIQVRQAFTCFNQFAFLLFGQDRAESTADTYLKRKMHTARRWLFRVMWGLWIRWCRERRYNWKSWEFHIIPWVSGDEKAPSFLLVLTAVGDAYKREDGVYQLLSAEDVLEVAQKG